MKAPPPLVETELVSDKDPNGPPRAGFMGLGDPNISNQTGQTRQSPQQPGLFHPLSATLLLSVDLLWGLADWAVLTWFLTIPLSFLSVFFPVLMVQWRLNRDGFFTAAIKALFLGGLAAIPTMISGTAVGVALLAWAGIRRFR